MYWANGENLVLLPSLHIGTPVLVQVNDPEQFIDKVRQQWAKNR
jgi:cobalamin biosynthesis Co2+ chelatase CbiK